MLLPDQHERYRRLAAELLGRAGVVITPEEAARIEIADLALGEFETSGLALLTYVNTERVCAKELMMLPGQTCPQHLHPPAYGGAGKEETFRCRWGEVYLYVTGDPTPSPKAAPPAHRAAHYTVWHEIVLRPGEQYTIFPNTWHWFQAGSQGTVVSEFSTRNTDEYDVFVDPEIRRAGSDG